MKEIHLETYTKELNGIWDEVVSSSRNGSFLHHRDYMDYHAYRFQELSVIVRKGGKPVAVFPCNRLDDAIVSHSGLTYAGLIFNDELRAAEVLPVFEKLVGHYRSLGCRTLIYKAIPHIFHRYPAEEDLYALFRLGGQIVRRDLSTAVFLPEKIQMSGNRSRDVRKAQRLGLVAIEGEFLPEFHALLSDTLSMRGLKPVHTLEELRLLKSRFPSKIRLFGAFLQDKSLLAATLVYDFGRVAHTQYMACSENGKKIAALDFLLDHTINTIFSNYLYFSFGISTEKGGHYLNEGLVFQKESFGGRAIVHDFYELEL